MKLYQEGHLTDEQLRAFWAGAIDIAQATRFGQTYTVYIYNQGQVQLVFKEDNLIYITPNPEVLYFNYEKALFSIEKRALFHMKL